MTSIKEDIDLNREYSPSMWSVRFPSPEDVIRNHVRVVTEEYRMSMDGGHHLPGARPGCMIFSNRSSNFIVAPFSPEDIFESEIATNNIPHKLEIEYGPSAEQKLDILGTDLPNDAPIMMYIHGGYWQELSREISRYPAGPLYMSGIKTVVVGYDLCPTASLLEIIEQIHRAASFVFEYAEKMGSRGVYFAGHSAGAHLVAKLIASSDIIREIPGSHRLQGAFLISGIYDLRDIVNTYVNDAVQLPAEWAVALSPQFDSFTHLQGRRVRVYIIAGQHDSPTFKRQSREFYEHLNNTCLLHSLYLEIKDGMDHFDIVECFAKEENYLRSLLVHDVRKYL